MTGEVSGPGIRVPLVELLWFDGCANHAAAHTMVREVLDAIGLETTFADIDATDPTVAAERQFGGSPTVRVDGIDVDPTFVDSGDHTPRCRLYRTAAGLGGLPERAWVEAAIRRSMGPRGATGRC